MAIFNSYVKLPEGNSRIIFDRKKLKEDVLPIQLDLGCWPGKTLSKTPTAFLGPGNRMPTKWDMRCAPAPSPSQVDKSWDPRGNHRGKLRLNQPKWVGFMGFIADF